MLVIRILKSLDVGIADFLHDLMLFFPHYSLTTSIQNLQALNTKNTICAVGSQVNEIYQHDLQTHLKSSYCGKFNNF